MPDPHRRRRLALPVAGVAAGLALAAIAAGLPRPPAPEAAGPAPAPAIDPVRGVAWRRVELPPAIAQLQDVTVAGETLVALGSAPLPGAGPTLAVSRDGERWTVAPPAALGGDLPLDLQASGDLIVAGAGPVNPNGDVPRLRLFTSTDGLAWVPWLPARPADPVPDRVVPLGTGWAATDPRGIVSSADGRTWAVDSPAAEDVERPLLAAGGGRAVAAVSRMIGDGSWRTTILVGDAPGRWRRVPLDGGGDALAQQLAVGPGRMVVLGLGADRGPTPDRREWWFEDLRTELRPVAWWSLDGAAWTRAAWRVPPADEIEAAPFGRGFVGWSAFTGGLWWTDDGNRWTALEAAPWAHEGVFALVVSGRRLHGFTWGEAGAVEWIGTPR